jgi:hypothetical protein
MSDPLAPRVGGILSADIAVPEHERVKRFYSRVLSTGENPLWREDRTSVVIILVQLLQHRRGRASRWRKSPNEVTE